MGTAWMVDRELVAVCYVSGRAAPGCGALSHDFNNQLNIDQVARAAVRFLQEISQNDPFVISVLAWVLAQGLKGFTHYSSTRQFDLRMISSSGGMPSSHSALVGALGTAVGIQEGFDSPLFAICVVFGIIVMYDASGVRLAAGHQARILNQIVAELFEGHPISQRKLKELIGHTPFQVIMGAILGIVLALLWM